MVETGKTKSSSLHLFSTRFSPSFSQKINKTGEEIGIIEMTGGTLSKLVYNTLSKQIVRRTRPALSGIAKMQQRKHFSARSMEYSEALSGYRTRGESVPHVVWIGYGAFMATALTHITLNQRSFVTYCDTE